jgi:hypothetical protein
VKLTDTNNSIGLINSHVESSPLKIKTKVVSLGSIHHVNKIKLANLINRCVV